MIKMRIFKIIIILIFIIGLIIAGLYLKSAILDDKEVKMLSVMPDEEIDISAKDTITIFVPASDMKLLIKKRINIEKKDNEREKIKEIFYALRNDTDSIIPNSTQIKNIFIEGNLLYINLSNDIYNFDKNSSTEMMLVYSIVNTFCYGGITKVKILVNNQEIETLGGFVSLKDYFERDMLLVQGE